MYDLSRLTKKVVVGAQTGCGRCTLVDRALHACGPGAARLWTGRCTLVDRAQKIYIYIYIPLRAPLRTFEIKRSPIGAPIGAPIGSPLM